jgi:catechol 2,3-dioxygenase-like lactoylglutathione lyase family enzyme
MGSSNPRLHHISILTADLADTLAFYRDNFDLQIAARFYEEGIFDHAFLSDRDPSTGLLLKVVGPPFSGWLKDDFQAHGPGLAVLSFVVEDVDEWVQRIGETEVEIERTPPHILPANGFRLRDPCDILIEVLSFPDPEMVLGPISKSTAVRDTAFRFSHFCLTSRDLDKLELFYAEKLGMITVADLREEGMIFLADPVSLSVEKQTLVPMELFGPPGLWELDEAFLARYGPGLQYLCFAVEDVDAAHADLVAKGVECTLEPTSLENNRVAFFKDPNGVDIEILNPLPP